MVLKLVGFVCFLHDDSFKLKTHRVRLMNPARLCIEHIINHYPEKRARQMCEEIYVMHSGYKIKQNHETLSS